MGEDPPKTQLTVGVADGRLVLTGQGDGAVVPAVLIAGEGVVLSLDGAPAERLEVEHLDGVTVEVGSSVPVADVTVEVADDGASASLLVTAADGVEYVLADAHPAAKLTLMRREVSRTPASVELAAAHRALAEAGVVVGIDDEAVAAAVAAADAAPRVVAQAVPFTPPVDAAVIDTFGQERERNQLYTVPKGALLATKTPGSAGAPGTSVLGDTLPPPEPADAPLAGGTGTTRQVDEDGSVHLYAAVDGRPTHAGAMVIVEERITFHGDIGVETGDVDVNATLVVMGSVDEGREVRVAHDLEVHGDVDRAHLEAGGSLTVTGSCVHSQLRAGGRQAVVRHLLAALGSTSEDLAVVATTVEHMVSSARDRGQQLPPGRALLALMEGPYAGVRTHMAGVEAVIDAHGAAMFPEGAVAAAHAVSHVVAGLGMHELTGVDQLRALIVTLADQEHALRTQLADPSAVRTAYLQACDVEASGDLVITGSGIFNSTIFVGGDLWVEGGRSTLRGGHAIVGGAMHVHELGGDGGARMDVELQGRTVTPDRLRADVVHPGVHVTINEYPVVFEDLRQGVALGADEEGHLLPQAA